MDWPHIAEAVSDALEIVLVVRLLSLRLHTVYRIFCLFLLSEIITSGLAMWIHFAQPPGWDYRAVWLAFAPMEWVLYILVVYSLLGALLSKFPGILGFSRKVLHVSLLAAAVIGVLTARPEFLAYEHVHGMRFLDRLLAVGLVGERVFSMTALLALVATFTFILWFPVQMPRNLAVFSVGLVVFFAARTSVLIAYSFGARVDVDVLNVIVLSAFGACLLYWLIFINRAGEEIPARPGHSWNPAQQQRLLAQLEAMNASLLRTARR